MALSREALKMSAALPTFAGEALDPVAVVQKLVRCQSVTPQEGGALTTLENWLKPAGFTCHRLPFSEAGTPDVDNLYARLGHGTPHLCFAGHTDVVPVGDAAAWTHPPFGAQIHDGIIYGRGTVDMKGGVACFLAATARYLKSNGGALRGSISFLITGDEEGPSINGTTKILDWMAEQGEVMDACIVGEPSCTAVIGDTIKNGRRGSMNGTLTVRGKQGHAAYPHLADNPVPKLVRLLNHLSSQTLDAGTDDFEPSSLQVTVIDAPNAATNVIPARAGAKFNIRFNDHWSRKTLEAWARAQCDEAAGEVGAHYELSFDGTGTVFVTKPGPLVDTMVSSVKAVTGLTPELSTGGGTSDARFIHAYCPVIEFGLINKTIHQVDEHVPAADLEKLTAVYERFLADYFE